MTHTPTPVKVDLVQDFPYYTWSIWIDGVLACKGLTYAHASFIHRACNAHDELVAALKDILEYTGGADSALDDEYVMDRAAKALSNAEKGA